MYICSFPDGSEGKESACNVGHPGLIPWLGRFPGGGHGNPLQYPCLKNTMDRGTCQATIHGVTKSRTWLSNWQFHFHCVRVLYTVKSRIWISQMMWKWSRSVVSDSASPSTVICHAPPSMWFPRQEYWVGCQFLLQGIFPTQRSSPGLPHCRQTLYHLSHQDKLESKD